MKKHIYFFSLLLLILCATCAQAEGMDGKTDYSTLSMVIGIGTVFLIVSILTVFSKGANFLSVSMMFISALSFFFAADIFINGSLVTQMTVDGTTTLMPVRNLSVSRFCQLIGLVLSTLSIVQILFMWNGNLFKKNEFGEIDEDE